MKNNIKGNYVDNLLFEIRIKYQSMSGIFEYFKFTYYTDFAVWLLSIIGLVISFSLKNKNKSLEIFKLLFFGHFISRSFNYFLWNISFNTPNSIPDSSLWQVSGQIDFFITVLEYLVIAFYFKKLINYYVYLLSSILFTASAIIIYILTYITKEEANHFSLFIIQAISIISICISYYINVFINYRGLILIKEPSFWIATGFFFFMISTLPYSVLTIKLYYTDFATHFYTFSIFHLFYVLLFLMIIKAFLCQPATSK